MLKGRRQHASAELFRGGAFRVTNLLSSFGGLKETRISAFLGYLIKINPALAGKLFGIRDQPEAVLLEPRSENGVDRYDVVLRVGGSRHVVEIKLGGHSQSQVFRYRRTNRRLFLIGDHLGVVPHRRALLRHFRSWDEVVSILLQTRQYGRRANLLYNGLADEFVKHLEEHAVIQGDFKDIYVRDVSGESLNAYFKHNIYSCQSKFYESAKTTRYFAPYLTRTIRRGERQSVYSVLGVGISFMSRIVGAYVDHEKNFASILKQHKYSPRDIGEIYESRGWRRDGKARHALFVLGRAMRLFAKPITKRDLWKIQGGAMPSMSVDFGDLVAAANGLYPLAKRKGQAAKKRKAKYRS